MSVDPGLYLDKGRKDSKRQRWGTTDGHWENYGQNT